MRVLISGSRTLAYQLPGRLRLDAGAEALGLDQAPHRLRLVLQPGFVGVEHDDDRRVIAIGHQLRRRLRDRIFRFGNHRQRVLVDRAALRLEELVEEGPDLLLPFLSGPFELLPRLLVIEKHKPARPAIGERHKVERVENPRPALGGETVDPDHCEEPPIDHGRQTVVKLGRCQPIEIHRDRRQAHRMAFADNAETDELKEFVIARFIACFRIGDRARHHAADHQHIAKILFDLADRCLERGQHAIGIGFGPARLVGIDVTRHG